MASGVLLNQEFGVTSVNGVSPDTEGNVEVKLDDIKGVVPITGGGTGATTKAEAVKNIVDGEEIVPKNVTLSGPGAFDEGKFGINLANTDVVGAQGIYFLDKCDWRTEGIHFPTNDSSDKHYDTLYAVDGKLYFVPNRPFLESGKKQEVFHTGTTIGVANGGTGATSVAGARKNLGITSGSSAPSGGSDGDIYIQWV